MLKSEPDLLQLLQKVFSWEIGFSDRETMDLNPDGICIPYSLFWGKYECWDILVGIEEFEMTKSGFLMIGYNRELMRSCVKGRTLACPSFFTNVPEDFEVAETGEYVPGKEKKIYRDNKVFYEGLVEVVNRK